MSKLENMNTELHFFTFSVSLSSPSVTELGGLLLGFMGIKVKRPSQRHQQSGASSGIEPGTINLSVSYATLYRLSYVGMHFRGSMRRPGLRVQRCPIRCCARSGQLRVRFDGLLRLWPGLPVCQRDDEESRHVQGRRSLVSCTSLTILRW